MGLVKTRRLAYPPLAGVRDPWGSEHAERKRVPSVRRTTPVFFCKAKKEPAASYSRTGGSRTTLGDGALDCRVRNGNGYDNSSMATGKSRKVGD